ncbi:hypothetical protein RRG08_046832 [Elysia crispata]|uniref:Uncharacterized protein n=1 Tax=Elysia crispata TaxID=231223 RepID=A0AAE1DIZ8_9GAST|nr:hypothetical protein RRG08_046832 [Elysia crispata]
MKAREALPRNRLTLALGHWTSSVLNPGIQCQIFCIGMCQKRKTALFHNECVKKKGCEREFWQRILKEDSTSSPDGNPNYTRCYLRTLPTHLSSQHCIQHLGGKVKIVYDLLGPGAG